MATVNWQGVFSALLTPFKQNDEIDYDMFAKNLHAQVEAGIDGIVLGGSLGEANTLLGSEKNQLTAYSKEIVGDKIPVIVNIAEQSTKAAVQAAKDAEKNGADGLMLLPPMRYFADNRETLVYFQTVAQSSGLPIMIYNNPVDYKILVSLDMFEELAKIPTVQAVKESTRDISNITRMFNRFGERFRILTGVDPLAYESLVAGAQGWLAGLVDAFPKETVAIYRLIKAGRYKEALDIYRWFLPLLELDIHPKLVQYIKMAAKATGIGSEYVRAPRLVVEGEERNKIMQVIETALSSRPTLPDYLHL